jgi:hypothetical protein
LCEWRRVTIRLEYYSMAFLCVHTCFASSLDNDTFPGDCRDELEGFGHWRELDNGNGNGVRAKKCYYIPFWHFEYSKKWMRTECPFIPSSLWNFLQIYISIIGEISFGWQSVLAVKYIIPLVKIIKYQRDNRDWRCHSMSG